MPVRGAMCCWPHRLDHLILLRRLEGSKRVLLQIMRRIQSDMKRSAWWCLGVAPQAAGGRLRAAVMERDAECQRVEGGVSVGNRYDSV